MPRASHLVLLSFTIFNIVYNKQLKFPKLPIYCISSIFGCQIHITECPYLCFCVPGIDQKHFVNLLINGVARSRNTVLLELQMLPYKSPAVIYFSQSWIFHGITLYYTSSVFWNPSTIPCHSAKGFGVWVQLVTNCKDSKKWRKYIYNNIGTFCNPPKIY